MKTATLQAVDVQYRDNHVLRLMDQVELWRLRFYNVLGALVALCLAVAGCTLYLMWLMRGL